MINMENPKCEYLIRNGICGGNLDTCCIYQNSTIHPVKDYGRLNNLHETFCDYPIISPHEDYVNAIHNLAGECSDGQI